LYNGIKQKSTKYYHEIPYLYVSPIRHISYSEITSPQITQDSHVSRTKIIRHRQSRGRYGLFYLAEYRPLTGAEYGRIRKNIPISFLRPTYFLEFQKSMKWKQAFWLVALAALAGCNPQTAPNQTASPAVLLQPYQTRTPVITNVATPPATPSPAPSPTAFTYSIARGDTLNALAQRFGVTLDALLAANPGLSPATLSVGQKLNIPVAGQNFAPAPLATPAPLEIGPARCLPSASGSICLAPLRNPYPQALENVQVEMTILDAAGQPLDSQPALLPLNILAPGQTLPAAAFFDGLIGQNTVQVRLLTAQLLTKQDNRYLRADLQNLLVKVAWDGLSANLRGQVSLPQAVQPATRVWLVAVAYDSSGQIIGYRRWEATETLQPGGSLPFEMNVYSLGAMIEHVEVQIEAARSEPGQ
jgi:LysM repeat protein